ncbi:hypothetical protein F4680DRAFT_467967 [Xylaria scruposa]|nr:hypothetical protein F4680DRAFT_467967 [Xylaria scruposa]
MAGLVPPNAQAIAQILVQYISSTGACVIDLPAAAPALNICSSIEIRFKQEDVIEELADAICIEPTLAPAPAPAPVEPQPSLFKHPPPAPGPWRTKGSPRVLGDVSEEDCDEDENSHVVTPPMPDDPPEPLPTRVPVQERPVITQSSPTSLTPTPTPSISQPPAVEKSSSIVRNSTSISASSSHPSPSPSSSSSSFSTPSLPSSSVPSSSRPPPRTTPSSTPELPTLTLTKVLSSTTRPPPHSTSHSRSPSPTPTTAVRHPDPPKPPPPPPPPPPTTSHVPPPPPPPPTPVPDPCESAYTEIDVNKIESKPDSYDQYLHLVGIDLAQHHSKTGATEQEVKTTLIHQYRNRCGVDLPQGPAPVFPGVNGGQEQTEGYHRCLESCWREAILKAGDGLLHECLGVAYKSKPGAPNQGDCRFWSGDKQDNMLLPIHMFPDTSGSGNRWQVVYM